jgi:hypothetical protein
MKRVKLYNIVCSEKIRLDLLAIQTNIWNGLKEICGPVRRADLRRATHSTWADVYLIINDIRKFVREKLCTMTKRESESEF